MIRTCFRQLSCTCHRERVARHVHVLRASRIVGVARLLFESGDYFVHHFRRCGDYSRAATNRERRLIERIRYVCMRICWYLFCTYVVNSICPVCMRTYPSTGYYVWAGQHMHILHKPPDCIFLSYW